MPRIPLRDIPNAPQIVQQPTGGNLSGVNLGRAQTLLATPQIAQGAFDGAGKGLQALASGVAGAAHGFSEAVGHIKEQVDNNQVWKAANAFEQAYNSVSEDIAANPTRPEEYGSKMQKGLADAYQQFTSGEKLSAAAKMRIEQLYGKFSTESVGRMRVAGAKALFDENKSFAKDAYTSAVESGDTARAIEVVNQNRGKLFFDQEADGLIHHANQQGDELRVLQLSRSDPDQAQKLLDDAKQTPHIPEIRRLVLTDRIETDRRRLEAENWESLVNGVATETIKTPEDARAIFGDKFADGNAAKIKRLFPESVDPERQKAAWISIREDIAKIDPSNSKGAENSAYDVRTRISSEIADPGVRESLRAEMNSLLNKKPEAMLRSQMTDALTFARQAGVFGQWDEDDLKDGDQAELTKKNAAYSAMYRVQQDAEAWMRKNPTATSEELGEWLNRRMSREIKQVEPGWWGKHAPTWLGGAKAITPNPAPIEDRIGTKLERLNP